MKITKSTLQRIIKEEHEKLLSEAFYDKSGEYAGRGSMEPPQTTPAQKPQTPYGTAEVNFKEYHDLEALRNAVNANSPSKTSLKMIKSRLGAVYVQLRGQNSLTNLVQAAEQKGIDQKLLATAKAILHKQG